MEITLRQETDKDYQTIERVVEESFRGEEYSDGTEHLLVDKLRKSNGFVPELSLVAEVEGNIIGHIMLTRLSIKNGEKEYESLSLAPLSVLPSYQNQGVGSKLTRMSLKIAKELGFKSVVVVGHEKYYPRFGFKPARLWGIKAPFDVPKEAFMALELEEKSLEGVSGIALFPREFFE
ncbi:MAG: N-acetyltransferase [Candidatus Syntrophonatronum acetioxidans]|uniref:N-acetyltransferase n=1 Tax=Candidatus Syntrophonatronum acetioxidans TaxID=1795816 RepID=A0A424YGH4_9FIRM|nr:MAG: N-acetyltransferase [Candidatus Syntrophonatronum acetioxidans]